MTQLNIIGKCVKMPVAHADVKAKAESKGWFYSETVKEHFFNPRNFLANDDEAAKLGFDGMGMVGSPACGDGMKMWIRVKDDRITECRWQTFGCASAISSTSMLSVMVTEDGGMPIEKALQLKPMDIMDRLGGLPARKFHCSVLGDKALRAAINDHFRRAGQKDRIVIEGARIIDPDLKVTDKDIEEAVLEGADTVEKVQQKLKVGVFNKACLPAVEELVRFYKEKYSGRE